MLSREAVEKVAHLAKLKLTEEEKETLGKQLISIIEFVNELRKVDTSQVEGLWYSAEGTPLREDAPQDPLSQEKALRNAPERENGFFVVPRILEL
ncbi:Asp-tRNA(Asn)/Glu-tRNA(Gln) amidotransferase subunit GatC [Thermocrinis sp.]